MLRILQKATTGDLCSLEAVKDALDLPAGDTAPDKRLGRFIRQASDTIARLCNRETFGLERVEQTLPAGSMRRDVLLERDLVPAVQGVTVNGVALVGGFHVDFAGVLRLHPESMPAGFAWWAAPWVVTYDSGYDLPDDVPPALERVALDLVGKFYGKPIGRDPTMRSDTTEGMGTTTWATGDKPMQMLTFEEYPVLYQFRRMVGV